MRIATWICKAVYLGMLLSLAGCTSYSAKYSNTQTQLDRRNHQHQNSQDVSAPNPVIVRINNRPIHKETLLNLLLHSRGRALLDELILLEIVRQYAFDHDITMDDSLIDSEYVRILEDMAPGKSRSQQRSLLQFMLDSRGLTRTEFNLIVERQALLRQIIEPNLTLTEQDLAEEYQRTHGQKVEVRQLLVNNLPQIETVQKKINQGESFLTLIRQMSQDQRSLTADGLLPPFARNDNQIPQAIRTAAFELTTIGQYSSPVHYRDENLNEWWAILRLESIIPPDNTPLGEIRNELTQTLRRRLVKQLSLDLLQKLKAQAEIVILDPALKLD